MSISREIEAKKWLDHVPTEWDLAPMGRCGNVLYGWPFDSNSFGGDEECMPLIRIRDITTGTVSTYYSGPFPQSSVVKAGDILVGMDGDFNLRVWDGPDALLNQRCCKVSGSSVLIDEFLAYALPYPLGVVNDLTLSTTVKHLLADGIEGILMPLPPIAEQQAICSVLTPIVEKTNKAITLLNEQIETLEAYKRSLIQEAVTKGLDPDVPMKPSGVEWIGCIPESWDMSRLRYLTGFESGATPSKDELAYWDGDIPWVSSMEVKDDVIEDTSLHITPEAVASCSTRLLPRGTLVMVVRSGILQHTIPVALLGRPMTVNQDVKALSFGPKMTAKYFFYLVRGNNDNLLKALLKDKSTVDNINQEYLKSLLVPVPPVAEQNRISDHLDAKCASIDKALALKREQLETLRQQRQSLIYEYVTGKRRVS